jgi:hypothetical protein
MYSSFRVIPRSLNFIADVSEHCQFHLHRWYKLEERLKLGVLNEENANLPWQAGDHRFSAARREGSTELYYYYYYYSVDK